LLPERVSSPVAEIDHVSAPDSAWRYAISVCMAPSSAQAIFVDMRGPKLMRSGASVTVAE
jgi:hypothetical protein